MEAYTHTGPGAQEEAPEKQREREKLTRARRYMGRIAEARRRVWELTERLEQCDAMLRRAGATLGEEKAPNPGTSGKGSRAPAGKGKNGRPTPLEEGVWAVARLRERLGEELAGYAARVREAEWAIGELDNPTEREVLRLRYLCGEEFNAIAEKLHYSDARYMRKVCAAGLRHIQLNPPIPGGGREDSNEG